MKYSIWWHREGVTYRLLPPGNLPVKTPKTLRECKAAADRLLNNPNLRLQWVEVRKETSKGVMTVVYRVSVLQEEEINGERSE